MMNIINLPLGTVRVPSDEVPLLIAIAITPIEQASTVNITAILKKNIPLEKPYDVEMACATFPTENLTDSDWDFLNFVCELSDLQPLMKGKVLIDINLSKWELYEKVFEEYKPDWKLMPFSNTVLKIVANKHREYLCNSILKGDVVVHNHLTHIPLEHPTGLTALEETYMTIGDFTSYAKKLNLTVLVGDDVSQNIQPHINITKNFDKKIQVSKQYDTAILTWLKEHNYDPQKLPKPPKGKAGVKKQCREALCKNIKLFSSVSVFDTAWERLRKNLEIKDVN